MSAALECATDPAPELADSGVDHQEWLARCHELARTSSKLQFEIGDLLTEGVDKWSRETAYDEASAIFSDYTRATLQTFASVARSVEPLTRVKDLPWAHHRTVARLEPEKQRELLSRAKGMTVSAFRKLVNQECPPNKPDSPDRPVKLTLMAPPEILADMERLALALGDEVESTALFLIRLALQLPDIRQKLESLPIEAA
jgi:hypothetical protein